MLSTGTKEVSAFTYAQSWLNHPRRFPIAPDMPLTPSPHFTRANGNASTLPGPISDTAPDSWGRAIIRAGAGGQPLNDLDYLLEVDDHLRSGALRMVIDGSPVAAPRDGVQEASIPRLVELDAIINEARAFEADPIHYRERRADLIGGRVLRQAAGSLGGARPKVNAVDDEGRIWIVKLAKMDDDYAMARAEVLALRLADKCGIKASTASVLNTSQRFPVALVRRFDRTPDGQRVPFISAQTFMGLPGTEPSSYADIAERMTLHSEKPDLDSAELWKRMAFNILIQNTDDHLRNHGFLLSQKGQWRLSPAFDVNPVADQSATLKTSISPIHGNSLDIDAAIDAAPLFAMTEDEARQQAGEMARIISTQWQDIGKELGMTSSDKKAVKPALDNPRIRRALEYPEHARNRSGPE